MRITLIVAMLFVLSTAAAQNTVGIRGGVSISNIHNSNSEGRDRSAEFQSYNIGLMGDVPFSIFSFQPSIMVTGKGSRVTFGDEQSGADYFVAETNPVYLEIPATLNINLRMGDAGKVHFGLGPYGAVGIGGTNRVYGRRNGNMFGYKEKIYFNDISPTPVEEGGAYSTYDRYDYGVHFAAGLFVGRMHIGTFYSMGLAYVNRTSNPDQRDYFRHGTFGVNAGFVLSGKPQQ